MTFINNLPQQSLWYSRDWEEYVWHCKKKKQPPAKYELYWRTDLIKGHICTGVETSVTPIKQEKVQTKVWKNNLLTTGFGKATQCVFLQHDSFRRLEMEIQGKIHVEITAAEQVQGK